MNRASRLLLAALLLPAAAPSRAGDAMRLARFSARALGAEPAALILAPAASVRARRASFAGGEPASSGYVSGQGTVTGSAYLPCTPSGQAVGHAAGDIFVSGSVHVSGTDGFSGSVPVSGSIHVSGGCYNGSGFIGGGGQVTGTAYLSDGRGHSARAELSGTVYLNVRAGGFVSVSEQAYLNGHYNR